MSNPNIPGVPDWFTILDHDAVQNRVSGKAPLNRYLVDEEVTGIREGAAYDESDDQFEALKKSLNKNGELRLDTDLKTHLSDDGQNLKTLGGNRRLTAALTLLREGVFKPQTPVRCFLYLTTDKAELSRIAGRDNAFSRPLNEMEMYRQIVAYDKQGLSILEIAANHGISDSTVNRYLSISRHPVLVAMLEEGMPYSRLARIAEKLKDGSADLKNETMAFLDNWLNLDIPARIAAKKTDASRRGKTVKASQLEPGKLLKPGEYEGWLRDIDDGIAPTGKPRIGKMIVDDSDGRTLRISSVNLDLSKTTSYEIGDILAKVQIDAVRALKKALKGRQRAEKDEDDGIDPDLEKARLFKELNLTPSGDDGDSEAGDDADADADDEGADADDVAGFDDDAT